MNLKSFAIAGLVAASVSAVSVQAAPKIDAGIMPYQKASGVSGNLSSVGSDTLANLMTLWAEEFKRALVESPRFCLAHHYLGLAYMELKKFQEAVSEFRLAIKYCPKYAEAYLNLGMAYVKKGQTSDACAEFRRVKEFGEEGEFSRTAERYLVLLKCAQEKE